MTNEQRKAIEKLRKLKEYNTTYFGSMYFKVEVKADEEMKETIDTVLSLIKEQQEKIENITTNYKNLIADVSSIAKELELEEDATIDEIYTAIRILKSKRINVIEQLDCIQQKDKQIDLMAEFIRKNMMCLRLEIECNKMAHNCEDCIKQYFADLAERKVEDGN